MDFNVSSVTGASTPSGTSSSSSTQTACVPRVVGRRLTWSKRLLARMSLPPTRGAVRAKARAAGGSNAVERGEVMP